MPAGVLHHACNVRSRTVGDRHRRQLHRTARRFRRPAHAGKLGKALRAGHRRDAEHCLRPRQSLQQESIADHRIRPTGLAQSAKIGPKHDAGVDQRPAAEAGCAEHGQPLADRQVVEPGRIAQLRRAARQPHRLAPCLARSRKIAGPPKPPLLEDRQAQTHAREAGCCDTAAVAGADDDRIVDRHRFADCLGCKNHETLDPPRKDLTRRSQRVVHGDADAHRCRGICLMLRVVRALPTAMRPHGRTLGDARERPRVTAALGPLGTARPSNSTNGRRAVFA